MLTFEVICINLMSCLEKYGIGQTSKFWLVATFRETTWPCSDPGSGVWQSSTNIRGKTICKHCPTPQ